VAEVCVDASFALKLVLYEPERERVREEWSSWLRNGNAVIAPWLWAFETHAVLRRKVAREEMTDQEAREAWRVLRRQGVQVVHPRGLFDRAWSIAAELSRPTTYDAVYLAVADLRGCEFWTADHRLLNSAGRRYSWMRSI
jgi:predicted nucleic acid-binding protein